MQVQTSQINNSIKVSEELNTLLASEYTLYTKLRNFHWNVVGPHFQEYHKFFEESYEEVEKYIDDTAEKIRTLGYRPYSSMGEFLKNTFLKESTEENMSANQMLSELSQDYQTIIKEINSKIKVCQGEEDVGVEDYLTGILQEYEKRLWMINSMNS